ncbi:MAG TPA: NDP-sugar synthase [Candidatus Nanopelagicaceae bacterium]|nr:NDP-sugar synthase [Candidatus Nanopelagicaceae bacterium]
MREAILLVGGQGTRLRPLTDDTPKPMLSIAGAPITAHQLAKARAAGIDRIILATSYLSNIFEPYFGDGSEFGVELVYALETTPLGTGGAIANAGKFLISPDDSPITIFNGDVLSGHDLTAQIRQHVETNADLTLYLTEVADARPFGCVPSDDSGRITDFLEKMPNPITNQINAGCYVFRRSIIERIPRDAVVSVERETFPELLSSGANVRAFVDTSYWLDLGTAQALVAGSRDLVLGLVNSGAVAPHSGPALIAASASIDASAEVDGGSAIGRGCNIAAGAKVSGSVLLDNVQVGADARVIDSYIGENVRIGPGAILRGTAIGSGSTVLAHEQSDL